MITRYRKAVAALGAGFTVFVAAGLITGTPAVWITTAITAAGAGLGAYAAKPNESRRPKPRP